jgi:hypothetical protein
MKKKVLFVAGIVMMLAFAGCEQNVKSCPRNDNCSGSDWCQQSSCNARYSDVELPCNCGN